MGFLYFGAGKAPVAVNQTSDEETTDAIHVTGACAFGGLVVKTDGTNDVTLTVYDGTDNTGTKLLPEDFVVVGTERLWSCGIWPPLKCDTGVYIEISGTGGSVQAIYDQG